MQLVNHSQAKPIRLFSVISIQLLQPLLLVSLFSGLLSLAYLNDGLFYLAWLAFVPLLFAIDKATLLKTYLLGSFAGLSLFISGTYWVADFVNIAKDNNDSSNLWIAFAYWLYCSQLIALMLLFFNWFRNNTKIHDFLLFPVVVATFTSGFPMLFPMRLGESQINFYSALQATEFVGVHGLDTIIALSNIIVFRFVSQYFSSDSRQINRSILPWVIGLLTITFWFSYGAISYSSWESQIAGWDTLKIGLVQPNEIPKLGKRSPYPGYSDSYPPEMEMSERLAAMDAEIIIWPEGHPKGYLNNSKVAAAYRNNIDKIDSSLLFQDLKNIIDPSNGKILSRYNSAIMLNTQGEQVGHYNKIKRIPFGEYIPMLTDGSILKRWLESYLGQFLNKHTMGDSHKIFKHEKINIIPLICYETTFPDFVGAAVGKTAKQANTANGTFLIGLSNDGWFGSSHQPYQHIMASVLRAVENRLPLIHSANNGPSIVVAPHGKVIFTTDFQQAGGYVFDVPHSNTVQGSFYSRHPTLFINMLYGIFGLMILAAIRGKIQQLAK
jgi:apolipoprotein N-acyltransferase